MSEWENKRIADIVEIRVSNVDKKVYPSNSVRNENIAATSMKAMKEGK